MVGVVEGNGGYEQRHVSWDGSKLMGKNIKTTFYFFIFL